MNLKDRLNALLQPVRTFRIRAYGNRLVFLLLLAHLKAIQNPIVYSGNLYQQQLPHRDQETLLSFKSSNEIEGCLFAIAFAQPRLASFTESSIDLPEASAIVKTDRKISPAPETFKTFFATEGNERWPSKSITVAPLSLRLTTSRPPSSF